MACKFPVAMKS